MGWCWTNDVLLYMTAAKPKKQQQLNWARITHNILYYYMLKYDNSFPVLVIRSQPIFAILGYSPVQCESCFNWELCVNGAAPGPILSASQFTDKPDLSLVQQTSKPSISNVSLTYFPPSSDALQDKSRLSPISLSMFHNLLVCITFIYYMSISLCQLCFKVFSSHGSFLSFNWFYLEVHVLTSFRTKGLWCLMCPNKVSSKVRPMCFIMGFEFFVSLFPLSTLIFILLVGLLHYCNQHPQSSRNTFLRTNLPPLNN